MWYPSPDRNDLKKISFQAAVLCSLMFCGCAWGPVRLGPTIAAKSHIDTTLPSGTQLSTQVPVPVFDDDSRSPFTLPQRIASTAQSGFTIAAPTPFAWKKLAMSAGDRDIDGATLGNGGYRTLVIGSLAGNDPLAIALTEQFARHVHQGQLIFGGAQATVIRNPNPDGEALKTRQNAHGVYLNRSFSEASGKSAAEQEPEIRFLRNLLEELQPQRVIHIRTLEGSSGVVAASAGAAGAAKDLSEWLQFRSIELPGDSADGTLERILSSKGTCDVITLAIPGDVKVEEVWELYGDSLLNLMLHDDYETRVLARRHQGAVAADRRGKKTNSETSGRDD